MNKYTDLCIERLMDVGEASEPKGYESFVTKTESSKTTVIEIKTGDAEKAFSKPKGKYITIEVPPFSKDGRVTDDRLKAVADELKKLIPGAGEILIVGLGNRDITADALGPLAMTQILATRHLKQHPLTDLGLDSLRDVSVIIPGVLGQTGIEVTDVVKSVADLVRPAAVITVDALAAREISRLGCTVQITDAGVAPGSGVGNGRPELSLATLGIPVIGVGVPTVIPMESLIVTPKDIDVLVQRAAKLIALAINCSLFPEFSTDEIIGLVC